MSKAISFKLVGSFGYRENYAAHCWDGFGDCPQGWKNKSGDEVLFIDGLTLQNVQEDLDDFENIAMQLIGNHCWSDEYSEQYFLGFHVERSNAWNKEEIVDAYCDWYEDIENDEIFTPEPDVFNKYELLAEELGLY